jgi:hypothetical protein
MIYCDYYLSSKLLKDWEVISKHQASLANPIPQLIFPRRLSIRGLKVSYPLLCN